MNFYPPGSRIAGRYEVASRPLLGGMGIVYFCYDRRENRPVALKTFKPEYLPDRAARDRFLREGDTWIRLGRYPHIVQAYGVERVGDGTEVYFVLELITKEQGRPDASLRSWLTPGRPLPIEHAMLFAIQVVRGMHHATENIPGFVHRDLKPENLLVGSDKLTNADINRLRVTDFGLVSMLGELREIGEVNGNDTAALGRTQLTRGIVGTPPYMAPEQWRGEPVTVVTDIYAFGLIFAEMLIGKRVVIGDSLHELQNSHLGGRLRELPTHLSTEIRDLVSRCQAIDPRIRYTDWADVLSALQAAYRQSFGKSLPEEVQKNLKDRPERIADGWSLSEIGKSYLDLGNSSSALIYFERAKAIADQEEEPRLKCSSLTHLGLGYTHLGEMQLATVCQEQALDIAIKIADRRMEGAALGNFGLTLKLQGELLRAIGFFEQCLVICRETLDYGGEAASLGNLGATYMNLGEIAKATEYFHKCLELYRDIQDQRGETITLGHIGDTYAKTGDFRKAISFNEQALVMSRKIGDRRQEAEALGSLGWNYWGLGELKRAIGYFELSISINREIGDKYQESSDLGALGDAYYQLGDSFRALALYEQSLMLDREIGDRLGEGNCLASIARVYSGLGNIPHAIETAEAALTIHQEIGYRRGQAVEMGELGNAYQRLGKVEEAVTYYERCGVMARDIQDHRMESAVLTNLGAVYASLGNLPRALEYFAQSIEIDRESGNILGEATTSVNVALLLAERRQYSQAISYATRAFELFSISGSSDAQRARLLIEQLKRNLAHTTSPSLVESEELNALINTAVAAADGNPQAKRIVEKFFDDLSIGNTPLAKSIGRIWQGARAPQALLKGLDEMDAFIVREILARLKQ